MRNTVTVMHTCIREIMAAVCLAEAAPRVCVPCVAAVDLVRVCPPFPDRYQLATSSTTVIASSTYITGEVSS